MVIWSKFYRRSPRAPEYVRLLSIASTARVMYVVSIGNISHAEHQDYFVMNSLVPLGSDGCRTAPIYAHTGDHLISVIDPGSLGIPVLKHIHHVWPHYVKHENGGKTLYLLVHGWRDGKFAVLKHEPEYTHGQ